MKYIETKGIGKFVKFLGVVTGEERRLCLQNSDLFVLPTYFEFEGLPLSILEAMSYGCAIIATDHAAISSAVEDGVNGLLCETNNSRDLALKIMHLLNNRDMLLKIQTNNIKKFNEQFTAEHFGEKLAYELTLLAETNYR